MGAASFSPRNFWPRSDEIGTLAEGEQQREDLILFVRRMAQDGLSKVSDRSHELLGARVQLLDVRQQLLQRSLFGPTCLDHRSSPLLDSG